MVPWRPQQRARCCCLTEVSSSHSIPKLLGSQIHSHSYAVVQDRGRKREQLEWNMPASAKDPLHFIVNIWEVRGRRKGQVKNWTFPFYKNPCAVFGTVNGIDCSDLCIFLSYGSWSLNCNLFCGWLKTEEKRLSGTARLDGFSEYKT